MKHIILLIMTCILIGTVPASAKIKGLKRRSGKAPSVEIIHSSKQSIISYYANENEMTDDDAYHSPWLPAHSSLRIPLNGMWKAHSTSKGGKEYKNFYKAIYDVSIWEGTSFSETSYLQDSNIGYIPRYYRRTFDVPSQWKDRLAYLHFTNLDGKATVWLNGKKAGSVQGNGSDEELNVTSCIRIGKENVVALELHDKKRGGNRAGKQSPKMYSSHRDIYLEARPLVYIQDIHAETYLNEDLSVATVMVDVQIRNTTGKVTTATPSAYILAPNGTQEENPSTVKVEFGKKKTMESAKLKVLVVNPALWTGETPHLYTLNVKLGDDIFTQQYAIRRMEKQSETIYLNNNPLTLRCVDVTDAQMEVNEATLVQQMESDMRTIKELGVNAVCVNAKSCDARLYALCDYYGLYILEEPGSGKHFSISDIRDQTQHAKLRKECRDVTFKWDGKGSLIVENNYSFTSLKNFRIFFTATQKTNGSSSPGDVLMQGYQDLPDVRPGKSISIPFPLPLSNDKETTTLNIRLQQKVTTRWTEAGKDVVSETIKI